MIMLVVDTILYMMLVWYIEGVWPGRYGVAKPFYFPFQPLYWLDQKTWTVCKKYLRIGKKKVSLVFLHLVKPFIYTMYYIGTGY